MIVYRITKSNKAGDMSGAGASLYPGRWNKKGTPVLYTGENKEIALLETLVHLPAGIIPESDILTIEIPDDSITQLTLDDLPVNWHQFPAPAVLSEMGQKWVDEGNTIALKVPSSIVYSAHIFILNCNHANYKTVKIVSRKKFYFDSRLKK